MAALGSSVCAIPAHAVVEQTDGVVVPIQVSNCPGSGVAQGCVQVGLNIGEGRPATSTNNPVNAIFSATISPEVFAIPQTNGTYGTVSVVDMIEGAGYENTFGWYNITAPAQLYPITPCADEPTSTRMVDFQAEFTAGRYLGGFIGFFLITPENAPINDNCGRTNNVGHIYYTERARNGDGNYVHYLLYHSAVNPLAYYFGFEDLYRGGDNDFEDMFLKVTGLLAPCTPSAEVCDGLDNNCDGLVDNSPVNAGNPCGTTDVGECSLGTLTCQTGILICVGAVGPSPEQCNGLDDDCNGMVDDAPTGAGGTCGTDVGECNLGLMQCIGGSIVCVGGRGPSLELCNNLDDDCNGVTDDMTIDSGGPCGSNIGECLPGVFTCINGMVMCTGGTPGMPETCNGLDDDCNGAIDDGNPGGGTPCGSDVGTCKAGVEYCIGGIVTCIGALGPTSEICDGLDNNCDGTADEAAQCPGDTACIEGSCAEKCKTGEFPCPGGQICKDGYCLPISCDSINCPPGTTCVQGNCIPDGASSSGSGMGGSGQGGNGSGGAGGAGGANGGMGGAETSSGSGGAGNPGDTWGLPTGAGGCACSLGARDRNVGFAASLVIGAMIIGRRRQRRDA